MRSPASIYNLSSCREEGEQSWWQLPWQVGPLPGPQSCSAQVSSQHTVLVSLLSPPLESVPTCSLLLNPGPSLDKQAEQR